MLRDFEADREIEAAALVAVAAAEISDIQRPIEILRDETILGNEQLLAVHVIAINSKSAYPVVGERLHPSPDAAADVDHRACGVNIEHDRNERTRGASAPLPQMREKLARVEIAQHQTATARSCVSAERPLTART